jgi:uncharacterized protein (TIGR02594 family)
MNLNLLDKLQNPGTRVILYLINKYEGKEGLKKVQHALNLMGRNLVEDGIVGPLTIDAIKSVNNRTLHETLENILLGRNLPQDQEPLNQPIWLDYAYEELGVKEIPGPKSNPRVEQYHDAAGGSNWKDDVPWCASFITFIMKKAGYSAPKWPAAAKSWLNFGKSAGRPVLGAIAVKSRKGGGHVCFVVGRDKSGDYVYCLGGNQSDAVNIKKYPTRVFLDFRIPNNYTPSEDLPIYKGTAEAAGRED